MKHVVCVKWGPKYIAQYANVLYKMCDRHITGDWDFHCITDNNKDLEKRPEAKNLIGIYSSLNDQDVNVTIEEFSGKNFSDLKNKLSELTVEKIYPISKEINKIKEDEKFIDQVLSEGNKNANEISSKKIKNMKKIIGF